MSTALSEAIKSAVVIPIAAAYASIASLLGTKNRQVCLRIEQCIYVIIRNDVIKMAVAWSSRQKFKDRQLS